MDLIAVNKAIENEVDGVISCWDTYKINPNGVTQKRLIVLTDFNLYVMKTKRFSSTLEVCRKYTLDTLTSIQRDPVRGAVVEFEDRTVNVKDPEVEDQFIRNICDQVSRIMIDSEIKVKFQRTVAVDPVLRLRFKMYMSNNFVQQEVSALSTLVSKKPTTVKFSDLGQNLNVFLPYLSFIPSIQRIIIDETINESTEEPLRRYISNIALLEEIEFSGRVKIDFAKVLEGAHLKVNKITFTRLNWEDQIPELMQAVFRSFSPNWLNFNNTLDEDAANAIASLKKISAAKNISIVGARTSVVNKIVNVFTSTKKFFIIDAKDDISYFISNLETTSISLEEFEFENCPLQGAIEFNRIPKIIKAISLKGCIANEEGIKTAVIAAHDQMFTVSNTKIQEGCDEEMVTQNFKQSLSMQYSYFKWDGGYFNPEIYEMIAMNQVDVLILTNIFNNKNRDSVRQVCDLIRGATILKVLDISVSNPEDALSQEELHEIINALREQSSIDSFFLNNQVLSEENLSELAEILTVQKNLTSIQLGWDKYQNQQLKDFFDIVAKRGSPIKILWNNKEKKDPCFSEEIVTAWKAAEGQKGRRKCF